MQFTDPALSALAAVIRTGSFESAAATLSVTPSAISQRIKQLEERIGTVLIQRGQPCRATDAGLRLCRHADQVALLESALDKELGTGVAPGQGATVRIAVNADSLATWFIAALSAQSDFLFDVVVDDQDHSADLLRSGAVMAAVSSHAKPVQGCDVTPLGTLRYVATASPAYADYWFAEGVTPSALRRAPALTFNARDGLQRQWVQREVRQAVALKSHFLPSSQAFVEGAVQGLGWGMNPELLVSEPLRRAQLCAIGMNPYLDVPLYWQINRLIKKPLRGLTRAVARAAKHNLVVR